eukprot:910981-Amphidinium_carterae.1
MISVTFPRTPGGHSRFQAWNRKRLGMLSDSKALTESAPCSAARQSPAHGAACTSDISKVSGLHSCALSRNRVWNNSSKKSH